MVFFNTIEKVSAKKKKTLSLIAVAQVDVSQNESSRCSADEHAGSHPRDQHYTRGVQVKQGLLILQL